MEKAFLTFCGTGGGVRRHAAGEAVLRVVEFGRGFGMFYLDKGGGTWKIIYLDAAEAAYLFFPGGHGFLDTLPRYNIALHKKLSGKRVIFPSKAVFVHPKTWF